MKTFPQPGPAPASSPRGPSEVSPSSDGFPRSPGKGRPGPARSAGFAVLFPAVVLATDPTLVPALRTPQAPPVAPPTAYSAPADSRGLHAVPSGIYSIGEPTDEEQLYVEYINRARSDPTAEGVRLVSTDDPEVQSSLSFFKVDLDLVRSQFAALASAAPLSIHPALTDAARRHSQDMFQNEFQGHTGSNGSSIGDRTRGAGYAWTSIAENVYSYADSVWHGHAGFNVDWGNGPGGIQTPPGHRLNIHNTGHREIGVGVVLGTRGSVGPQLVTQELGTRNGLTPFITGVVYYDFNGNQFYDLGEGVGGVTVKASGTAAYAVTARSGGYSIPVAGNGTYTVTFQVPGLAEVSRSVTVSGDANVKVDHRPAYSAPVLGGSSVIFINRDNPFLFSPVGAATSYDWRSLRRNPWSTPEGAEGDPGRFTADTSAGYEVRSTSVRYAGAASFHLAHPSPARSQFLTLAQPVRLGAGSQVTFQSRLGFAASSQVARLQVSRDGGSTWLDAWSQAGTGAAGERGFNLRQVSLGGFSGETVLIRFAYTFASGQYFPQSDDGVGWYLDEILVSNAEALSDEQVQAVSVGNGFSFRPSAAGEYLLQVRARLGDRILPWGSAIGVTATVGGPAPLRMHADSLTLAPGGGWELAFTIQEGVASALEVHAAPTVAGPWDKDASAVIEAGSVSGTYRARLPATTSGARFFRIFGR